VGALEECMARRPRVRRCMHQGSARTHTYTGSPTVCRLHGRAGPQHCRQGCRAHQARDPLGQGRCARA
jgi:hypothetical protein